VSGEKLVDSTRLRVGPEAVAAIAIFAIAEAALIVLAIVCL